MNISSDNKMTRNLPKDKFFRDMKKLGLALTYEDVRLRTMHSKITPNEISLESRFSRNVWLKIPIVSSPMDTVTEHHMAIEIAKLGGLGIIHKNLSSDQQAYEVAKTKYDLNGKIIRPRCVHENDTIESILKKREEKEFKFHTFPVINNEGRLVGMLTKNDFDFCDNNSLLVRDVMTKDVIYASQETTMKQAYEKMKKAKKKVLPIVDKNRKVVSMYVFSDVKGKISGDFSGYNVDKNGQLVVGAAIGVFDFERLEKLVAENVDVIVIDTAHGDSKNVIETLKKIKKGKYDIDVVVGNISEPESARNLAKAGADGIKVGQGPGSICTTRIIAGIGCPQVTAIYNCAEVAERYKIPVCADGGLKYSGDITVAIGAGAHSVMMGSMLAGTKESPGDIILWNGRQWKYYRGMGSVGAMQKNKGSRERYNQGDVESKKLVPEGIESMTPFKGELSTLIPQYVGGLKSGMGYVGAKNIEELRRKSDFIRMTAAGVKESHPHDVVMTKDAPNYQKRDMNREE